MPYRGIDVREAGDRIVFRSLLAKPNGTPLSSGDTTLRLFELTGSGTLRSYDWASGAFVDSGSLAGPTGVMSHQRGDNGTFDTGLWTLSLAPPSGFSAGGIYLSVVQNALASPSMQAREFQYGDVEGGSPAYAAAVLAHDLAAVSGEAPRSLLNAARFLRNRWDASGPNLVVYREDDAAVAWSGVLGTTTSTTAVVSLSPA